MMHHKNYTICLADWEAVLPELCSVITATYQPSDFTSFEDSFVSTGSDASEWKIAGEEGCSVSVLLEKHEGYFFGTLVGSGDSFTSGANLLWKTYLAQGGKPDAQEKPRNDL